MLRCGLLGRTLGHSWSPAIHAELGDYEYRLFEVAEDALEAFLREEQFDGLNVTIPYKKAVMPYCAALSETAERIGSVNTIVRRADGTLYGDNTDAFGFSYLLGQSGVSVAGRKALVLGSGGASATVQAVLRSLGAQTVVISRSGTDNYGNLERHADAALIVNTTPLGMYPKNGEAAVDLTAFPRCEGVVDLIYNPARTALLLQAEKLRMAHAGGLSMLVAQAKRSAEIFTGTVIDDAEIARIERLLAREMRSVVLVGMPGCGKSALAQRLGAALGREVLDSDEWVRRQTGRSPAEIIRSDGESAFRAAETEALRELGKRSGVVLATGGGCVTREENYPLLHQNGVIVWVRRDLNKLAKRGRPLSAGDLHALYARRAPLYERFADVVIENDATLPEVTRRILQAIE